MTNLLDLTLTQARAQLDARAISAVELTQAYVAAVEADPYHAYVTKTPEKALAMAQASDARLASQQGGLLEGIPLGIKDLFCTEGVRTTACSHILDGFVPTYESTVTRLLWQHGAVMLGKTNMDEFAMGSANLTSFEGPVRNPWSPEGQMLVPGGSSGGSAAAVAGRLCLGATASDTGGSIRQPASFCGITGIKPTYGRCSRWGMIAFASSLDQAGVLARNVADAALFLDAMTGHDPMDSTSAIHPPTTTRHAVARGVQGLRIGIPKEYQVDGMDPEIVALWERAATWLKEQGAEIHEISLPHTRYALPTYYIVAPAEASSNLARYDGVRYGLRVVEKGDSLAEMYARTRAAGFGPEVRRRILIGTYVLSAGYYDAYYTKAQQVRARIAEDFHQAFAKVDAILTPTAPSAAFAAGAKQTDPVTMYLNDVFTVPASLAGLPALSVPGGLSAAGLPLGLHVIGKLWDEDTVVAVGGALEQAAGYRSL